MKPAHVKIDGQSPDESFKTAEFGNHNTTNVDLTPTDLGTQPASLRLTRDVSGAPSTLGFGLIANTDGFLRQTSVEFELRDAKGAKTHTVKLEDAYLADYQLVDDGKNVVEIFRFAGGDFTLETDGTTTNFVTRKPLNPTSN